MSEGFIFILSEMTDLGYAIIIKADIAFPLFPNLV
jgi:hypothetical protein